MPLDQEGQTAFGGWLRWAWPWAYGDCGPLGEVRNDAGFPVAGFFLAAVTLLLFDLAALAAAGVWVPTGEPLRQTAAEAPRQEGYSVACAHNGTQALAAMHDQVPSLLVIDLRLPVVTGPMLIAACRAQPELRRVPVLLV